MQRAYVAGRGPNPGTRQTFLMVWAMAVESVTPCTGNQHGCGPDKAVSANTAFRTQKAVSDINPDENTARKHGVYVSPTSPGVSIGTPDNERNAEQTYSPESPDQLVLDGTAQTRDLVQEVFDHWKRGSGRNGHTILSAIRRKRITTALHDYPLADVMDAVIGWKNSPHHRGENDTGTTYNDLELLLRNSGNIERFRDYQRTPGAGRVHTAATRQASHLEAVKQDLIRRGL